MQKIINHKEYIDIRGGHKGSNLCGLYIIV
jgi:hypothetical protein